MKLYILFIIVLVFTLPIAFTDQIHPHMRCDITEKQIWDEELQKHDCIATSFTPIEPTCSKNVNYVWNQTGLQSYEQVKCNIPVTKIEVNLDMWELWEQYAWDFVFSGRYGW